MAKIRFSLETYPSHIIFLAILFLKVKPSKSYILVSYICNSLLIFNKIFIANSKTSKRIWIFACSSLDWFLVRIVVKRI